MIGLGMHSHAGEWEQGKQDFRASMKRGISGTRRPRHEVTNEPCRYHQPTAFRDWEKTFEIPFTLA
ncbi:MAG: hypothetical protein ACRESZ_06310 [Methylococcales bacterium]